MMRDNRGGNRPNHSASRDAKSHGGGQRTGSEASPPNGTLLAPLPASVRALAGKAEHPGLWLDKYARTWNPDWFSGRDEAKLSENVQKPALEKVVKLTKQAASGSARDFAAALSRHTAMLDAVQARPFTAITTGPLTLHLARAAALENAGLALHPLYGFAYLPATGLKGMARAYAEAVWLPSQREQDPPAAWHLIEDVFGWAPTPERRRQLGSSNHPATPHIHNDKEIPASAGQVVFHDAWPEAWPQLRVDIVNNHHPAYYGADEKKEPVPPPGDWENPRPVYFLAVEPGTRFRFALAPARRDTDPALLAQAEAWLLGALTHEGAGAKTAAGYGRFRATEPEVRAHTPELPEATRAVFETELELVTPAFLAGASQDEKDCDLRPATLRGVLRWWWRTLHAGFLEPAELRRLETAIWGSAEVGGAVRITVEAVQPPAPHLYDKAGVRQANNLHSGGKGIPGLSYISFGMDDQKKMPGGGKERMQRFYLEPAQRWRVRLTARDSAFVPLHKAAKSVSLSSDEVLTQAQAALWLLCHFGGVGSKARKGFGSFATPEPLAEWTLERSLGVGARFREAAGIGGAASLPQSPSFEWMMDDEIDIQARDAWHALDKVGAAYQQAVKAIEPKRDRQALGLPRNSKIPPEEQALFVTGPHVSDRHASPLHLHLEPNGRGWTVRAIAFPSLELPDDPEGEASETLLDGALDVLRKQL